MTSATTVLSSITVDARLASTHIARMPVLVEAREPEMSPRQGVPFGVGE